MPFSISFLAVAIFSCDATLHKVLLNTSYFKTLPVNAERKSEGDFKVELLMSELKLFILNGGWAGYSLTN